MSWDIIIQDFPREAQTIADIPRDFRPNPLGPRDVVISRIREVLPDVDFSVPSWGLLDAPGFSIEFSMGDEELCDSFALHVRGGGNAMATVARLLRHLQLRGIDCQTSEFFAIEAAESSFTRWQAYRDRIVNHYRPRPPVGSLIIVALMYLPWLLYFLGPRTTPGREDDMEFPGGIILGFFGLIYLTAAIFLPIRLYRVREASRTHAIAFYASLGILAMFMTLIWSAK